MLNRSSFKRLCTMLATALWLAATVAMFLFDKESRWFWLPDVLMICGFWPLLYFFRPSWPWLVFGVGCLLIAVEISACAFMSPAKLPTPLLPVRQHIIQHHILDPWLLLGLASILYGIIRAIKNAVLWLKEKT
jgi:hypothetical protein